MPILSTKKMTAEQFLQLGDDPPGLRLELVDGEVVVSPSPAPDHSRVVVRLIFLLETYNDANQLGELHHDVDTILNTFLVRRPDLLFYFNARTHLIGKKAMEGPPDLAVEVISPTSGEIDRTDKFAEYREAGVPHYWIVDPELRTIEAWRLKRGKYVRAGRGQGTAAVKLAPFPDLEIPLHTLWRPKR
jgi:Uma2 family endonuclease